MQVQGTVQRSRLRIRLRPTHHPKQGEHAVWDLVGSDRAMLMLSEHSHRVISPGSEGSAVRKGVVSSFNDSASSWQSLLCLFAEPPTLLRWESNILQWFCLTLLHRKRFRHAAATVKLGFACSRNSTCSLPISSPHNVYTESSARC